MGKAYYITKIDGKYYCIGKDVTLAVNQIINEAKQEVFDDIKMKRGKINDSKIQFK